MIFASTSATMGVGRGLVRVLAVAAVVGTPLWATGQTFPQQAEDWRPLPCGNQVMTDPFRDQSGASEERDIVGDLGAPAGYHSSDASFLYLRMRLEKSPVSNGKLKPFAWGVGVSVDNVVETYEVLIMVNGNLDAVELYANTTVTRPDSPEDPADQPPVASYPFATHGLVEVAPGSSYDGDEDFFLGFAVPWSDLAPLSLHPTTPVDVWAGTSSTVNALNGDLACHDGATGTATLSGISPERTVLDPTLDSDSDGYPDTLEVEQGTDPNDPASHPAGPPPDPILPSGVDLEGGGGCALSPAARGATWLVIALLLGLVVFVCSRRQRDRVSPSRPPR